MTNVREIEKFLRYRNEFSKYKVEFLKESNNYLIFLLKYKSDKLILRTTRDSVGAKNRLEKNYYILKFVFEEGIDFAEKAVYFNKENNILISSFVDGKETSVNNLSDKQLDDFIAKFVLLNSLSYDLFKKFCQKNKVELDLFMNPLDKINKETKDRFEYIKNNCSDKKIVEWVENELDFVCKIFESDNWQDQRIFFDHGDLAGANMFVNNNKLLFIDWDNAYFSQDIGYILANMFFYCGDLSKEFQNKFISLYSKYSKIDSYEIKDRVKICLRFVILSGIIWAVDIFTKMQENNIDGWEKYKDIAYERKIIFQNEFPNSKF